MSTHPVDALLPNSRHQSLKKLLAKSMHLERPSPCAALELPRAEVSGVQLRTVGHLALVAGTAGNIDPDLPERPCEDCGGSGIDIGGLNEYEPEDCLHCKGTGVE
jgi:hypothetical protein